MKSLISLMIHRTFSYEFLKHLKLRRKWYRIRKDAVKFSDYDFAVRKTRNQFDFLSPKRFDEKLWFLKLHNRDPLLTRCSDKYEVRNYVKEQGLAHILIDCYGIYQDAREIDFDTMPSPCILKCTHFSGRNAIFKNNESFNRKYFIKNFNFLLKQNFYLVSREWNYKNIQPRIICEKLLQNIDGSLPIDYKFLCFSGEPKLLFIDSGVCEDTGGHASEYYRNIFDMDFIPVDMRETRNKRDDAEFIKPINFEEMKLYASVLSKPFLHCRIDLYNLNGKIYFGEMTFYHGGGNNKFIPDTWDETLGSWIQLPMQF